MSEELREMLREQCILCGKAEWEEIHALCKNCQGKIQRDRGIAKAVKDDQQSRLPIPVVQRPYRLQSPPIAARCMHPNCGWEIYGEPGDIFTAALFHVGERGHSIFIRTRHETPLWKGSMVISRGGGR